MKWVRLTKAKTKIKRQAGTWSLPSTIDAVSELNKLMSQPLPAKDATDKLYDLFGDDDLFDEIDNIAEENPEQDVRDIVKYHLQLAENNELNKSAFTKEELAEAQKAKRLWRTIYESKNISADIGFVPDMNNINQSTLISLKKVNDNLEKTISILEHINESNKKYNNNTQIMSQIEDISDDCASMMAEIDDIIDELTLKSK